MPASTIFKNYAAGQQMADERERSKLLRQQQLMQIGEQERVNQIRGLQGEAASKGINSAEFKQLVGMDPEVANRLKSALRTDDQGLDAAFQDSYVFKNLLERDPSGNLAIEFGQHRVQSGVNVGRDMFHTEQFLKEIQQDPASAYNSINSFIGMKNQRSEMDEIALEKAKIELNQLRDGSGVDPEFLKEERKVARDSVADFNKRASEIRSSYGKVETVLNSGPLNRMKIASAMTSMARLLSPGIVTNQDFQNLSDSADPVALVLSTLTGKGDAGKGIATELQKYYDPTNPELFDKEAFLQTALSVAGAEIPTLLGGLEDAKSRAQRAGLRQRAIDTAFGENKNIKALTDLIGGGDKPVFNHPILGGVTESQIREAMKNKNLTREQVINKLKGG